MRARGRDRRRPRSPAPPVLVVLLAAAALLLASLGLAACGGDEDDDGGADATELAQTETETGSDGEDEGSGEGGADFNPKRIYERSSPGVVTVRSVFEEGGGGLLAPDGPAAGQGSGFVIGTDGEIVTNAHVVTNVGAGGRAGERSGSISEADEVFIEFADRNQVPAEIVGTDLNADIALLRVEADGLELAPLELGDSDAVEVGTPVAAIGSPFGQDQSLSIGIVSATNRAIESLTDFRIDGGIQTDASINPGNSGGPLIAPNGKVIGVNQQINTTSGGNEGVGFAVPANLVQRSIDDLRDDGEAEYAFLGVETISLYPQLADELEVDAPTGAMIVGITEGSPAKEAGLKGPGNRKLDFQGREIEVGGDVIVAVAGEELVAESDLARLISRHRAGEEIELEVIRDGKRTKVDVTLGERPDSIRP